ncbi:MAG: tetratricopeptide repeat protein [Pirellulales bacterium]
MNDHLRRADYLIQLDRYDAAEQELLKSLGLEPQNFLAHAWLALCYVNLNEPEAATESVRQAISLAPDTAYVYYVQALVCLGNGEPKEALNAAQNAVRLDPQDADYFWLRGYVHAEMRRYDEAAADALQGLALDAEHRGCLKLHAESLRRLGRLPEARSIAEQLLKNAPDDAKSHALMGRVALASQNAEAASTHFRQALRLNPNDDEARRGLMEALQAKNSVVSRLLKLRTQLEASLSRSGVVALKLQAGGLTEGQKRKLERQQLASPLEGQAVWATGLISFVAVPICNFFFQFNSSGRLLLSVRERVYATCTTFYMVWLIALLAASAVTRSGSYLGGLLFAVVLFPSVAMTCFCNRSQVVWSALILSAGLIFTSLYPWANQARMQSKTVNAGLTEAAVIAAPFAADVGCFMLLLRGLRSSTDTRRRRNRG